MNIGSMKDKKIMKQQPYTKINKDIQIEVLQEVIWRITLSQKSIHGGFPC